MTSENSLSQLRLVVTAILIVVAALTFVQVTPARVGESQTKESTQAEINRAKELLKSRQYEKAAIFSSR